MTLDDLKQALIAGDRERVVALSEQALAEGVSPETILEDALTSGMRTVGELFEEGECFVPEMLVAAEAMEAAMERLRPELVGGSRQALGKVVLGTVEGDLHDIGKQLVAIMLEATGFEVIDLGTSVPPDDFARAVEESGAELVGLSALLTTTVPAMIETIRQVRAVGGAESPKIMIGGAPVTDEHVERIGADGYAPDASRAAKLALTLTGAAS